MKKNEIEDVNSPLVDIVKLIEKHREKAYRKINEELVTMYYEIGKYLSEKVESKKWGSKVIDNIAKSISEKYPSLKGFNRAGLYRMMQFYETYKDNEIVSTLLRQISWSNNLAILSGTKTMEEKEFYLRMCIKNNYSARELNRQLSRGYFYRYMLSKDNNDLESTTRTINEDDIPATRILDQYSLEFLDLPNNYSEKDLRKSIVSNLKDFILEIGKDFAFVGEEYRIQVGDTDFYIDLLFYNRCFKCLVAFELKVGKFEPEYVSKMNFYLEALDRQEKIKEDNPSIGVILCSERNQAIVEYAMSRNISPLLVSKYSTSLIDVTLLQKKVIELRKQLENK